MSANPWCAHLIDVARQVIERVADPDLRAAFLFGSAAWGDADAGSDLDIMLLLDRPAGFREVTRVRVADLLARPLPDGPAFADFDCYSAAAFAEITAAGGGAQRVVHSVVLRDTDRFFAGIRDRVHAAYFDPAARAARYRVKREWAAAHRAALRQSRAADPALAALHARLALDEAAGALLGLNDDRLPDALRGERGAGWPASAGRIWPPFLRALGLDTAPERQVGGASGAYRAFADALRGWVADPAVGGRLSHEDRAWAAFTYGAQTYEEIEIATRWTPSRAWAAPRRCSTISTGCSSSRSASTSARSCCCARTARRAASRSPISRPRCARNPPSTRPGSRRCASPTRPPPRPRTRWPMATAAARRRRPGAGAGKRGRVAARPHGGPPPGAATIRPVGASPAARSTGGP